MRRSITSRPCSLRQRDHRLTGDAVEEAVGDRRVDGAVAGEEDVGAGAFGHAALPVEHHRVGIALLLGLVLGDGADHVEAGGLGMDRRALRIGPAIVGDVELDALHLGLGIEHGRPGPGGDGHVDLVVLGGDGHHLRAAPGHGAHILIAAAVELHNLVLGGVELLDRIGDLEIHDLGRLVQADRMLVRLEDHAAIGALALEDGGSHSAGHGSAHGPWLPSTARSRH